LSTVASEWLVTLSFLVMFLMLLYVVLLCTKTCTCPY